MNAETRAKEIVDDLASRVMAHGWEEDFHHPLLRQAEALISAVIIQAENDKLEEAARFFETGGDEAWEVYPKEIARNLRSLKFGTDILLERTFADDAPRSLEKD